MFMCVPWGHEYLTLCGVRPHQKHFFSCSHNGSLPILHLVHDDIIKWKHFPRYWPFVRRIHRSLVNYPHKGQWRGALMFSLICVWINSWVNNCEAGDLRRYRAHYDVTVMHYQNHPRESISWFSIFFFSILMFSLKKILLNWLIVMSPALGWGRDE